MEKTNSEITAEITPKQTIAYLDLEAEILGSEIIPSVHNSQKNAVVKWQSRKVELFKYLNNLGKLPEIKSKAIKKINNPLIKENKRQLSILQSVRKYPIYCIQGPPGTGKTSVIEEIIIQESKKNKIILVTSQSNLAVDNILERLIENKKISILRLGNEEKISNKIKPYRIKNIQKKLRFKKYFNNFLKFILLLPIYLIRKPPKKAKKNSFYKEVSKSIKVIGATCIGMDHNLVRYLKDKNLLELVIMDEAGKSTTMEALVPLQYAKRAILVGDQKQLPPVLDQKIRDYWINKYGSIKNCPGHYSFFEYLINSIDSNAKNILDTQYRMHPQIGTFISKVFYEKENLKNGIPASKRSLALKRFPDAISYHPTGHYEENRFEKFHDKLKSYYNPLEAKLCQRLVRLYDPSTNISIISFYSAQKIFLEKKFQAHKNVNIATLDSFQGREDDVVIISLVRSKLKVNDAQNYRFFLNVKRLNVAFSRAKCRLMIVGDLEHIVNIKQNKNKIEGIEVIEKLKKYILENDLIVKI